VFNAAKFGSRPLLEYRAIMPRRDGAQMAILATFLRCVFSASRVQHVSDMHSKFALRPHHVWKYGRHPISDCSD